ncbi:MAG: hypothetical protein MUQ65_12035 [Armatimonadetes bacterium]|nr:hypothetical protein [Armatimonadota bacterium]
MSQIDPLVRLVGVLLTALLGAITIWHRRRQHRAGIRPYLTAYIEKFLKPNVGTYYAVTVRNTGLGSSQNGEVSFYVKPRPRIGQGPQPQADPAKPMVRPVPSLDKGQSARIFETSEPLDGVCGVIVGQDIEGNRYWFRRKGFSDDWDPGEGDPPERPEE